MKIKRGKNGIFHLFDDDCREALGSSEVRSDRVKLRRKIQNKRIKEMLREQAD